MRQKSLFCSLTFWGIVLSYLNAIVPQFKAGVLEGFNLDFYFSAFEITIVFLMTLIGRYNANAMVFTPKGLPGRNKTSRAQ